MMSALPATTLSTLGSHAVSSEPATSAAPSLFGVAFEFNANIYDLFLVPWPMHCAAMCTLKRKQAHCRSNGPEKPNTQGEDLEYSAGDSNQNAFHPREGRLARNH